MKRKITTILLALALCLTLLPVGAGAVDTPSGTALTSDLISTLSPEDYSYFGTDNACYVLNGGTYYLDSDVTIDKPLLIKGTEDNPTTLDLKGHVLEYSNSATNGSVIIVNDGAHFVLQDTATNPQTRYATKAADSDVYTLTSDTTQPDNSLSLTGGVITGGTGTDVFGDSSSIFGGGVFVGSTATFEMTGGNIVGCTAAGMTANGGGVFVAAGKNDTGNQQNNVYTKFTMTGGSIVGCTAKDGGGVLVREHADFTMGSTDSTGNARIANCTATSGGGVYNNGTFTMVGSTIENCTASSSGGGVYSYGTLSLASGTIKNCPVGENAQGGSVHTDHGSVKNTSGTSSTIVYGEITHRGNSYRIQGKLVKFMNGETLYAETVAKDGGKISAPTPLPPKNGKDFDGWYSKNGNGYQKCEFTNGTAPVPAGDTLYAFWEGDFEVYATCDVNPSRNGYYETFAKAWDTSTGVDGETCTFKLLKDVPNAGSLTRSNKNTTLDLNGHTLTGSSNIPAGNSTMPKSFTVTDTSAGKNGRFDGTITVAENDAQLTVSGGTVNKVVVGNGGTLDCIGGTITTLTVTGGTVNHTGGTATCKELAECSVCHQPYGSNDPTNHVGTLGGYQHDKDGHWQVYSCCETATAKVAHDFDGSKCSVCGYEKPRRVYRGGAPTISAVLTHPDAASATNYNSGIYGLTFRSTASFSSFRGVQVDGKTIASSNYIAEEGSIVVYLKAVYLQTLSKGLHTVTILSTEGNATMDFTIGGIQSPKTADAGVAIYALMALTSCTGTALVVRGRKRK